MTHTDKSNSAHELEQISASGLSEAVIPYLDLSTFARHKKINLYQSHLRVHRRRVSLFVPEGEGNDLVLPGGIRPGSRFKMDSETKAISL